MQHINSRSSGAVDKSHYETRVIRFDGTVVEIEIFGSLMHTDAGILILGLAIDISARKADEASLRRAALIYQNSSEGMVVTDQDGVVIDVNSAFENITGYSAAEILGKRLNALSAGRHTKDFYVNMWAEIDKTGSWSGDIWNMRKTGEEFVEHLKINTIYNEDGSVHSRIGLFSDVTEKRRQEASIWRQANYDSLTKLPNRLMFHHSLEQEILHSRRANRIFALLFLDLDFFKDVNDTYGHDEGDELLKIMANRLKSAVRKSDLVARLGGDEFTIILRNIDSVKSIAAISEKIVQSVAQPYKLKSNTVSVSASVGIAVFTFDGDGSEQLLKNSDLAMYAAKEKGRNQFSMFKSDMLLQANTRRQLIQDINLALVENQFELYYQPIIDIKTGDISNCEALIRWHHPDKGLLKASDFINLAEATGQIHAIGDWVFKKAVDQITQWQNLLHKNISININVSPVQFQDDSNMPSQWLKFLQDRSIPVELITIEITERLYLDAENSKLALEKLEVFNNAGVKVALDDFGTGYSSLSHLNKLVTDFLKIDRSYIQELSLRSESYVLCQAIIVMAHELNIKVIAEGVTTQEQHDILVEAGCDYGQGYFYIPPLPISELNNILINK